MTPSGQKICTPIIELDAAEDHMQGSGTKISTRAGGTIVDSWAVWYYAHRFRADHIFVNLARLDCIEKRTGNPSILHANYVPYHWAGNASWHREARNYENSQHETVGVYHHQRARLWWKKKRMREEDSRSRAIKYFFCNTGMISRLDDVWDKRAMKKAARSEYISLESMEIERLNVDPLWTTQVLLGKKSSTESSPSHFSSFPRSTIRAFPFPYSSPLPCAVGNIETECWSLFEPQVLL